MPLTPDEALGNRVARARSLIEQLEFEEALGLLTPLHSAPNLAPALATEAGLLETGAWIALHQQQQAIDACKIAVAAAGYDPDIAREESPRVQAVCRTAAEQARQDFVQQRGLRVANTAVSTAVVAWNPIRVTANAAGRLEGLSVVAEVRFNGENTVVVNLLRGDGDVVSASVDANLAAPGTRVTATTIIRDAHGVLLRSETSPQLTVPTDESAVRLNAGSDEGPLRVDGQTTGRRARAGEVIPMPLGQHTLEVRTTRGLVSQARINLRRGEVALLTLHSEAQSAALDVARWGTTAGAVVLLGTGGVFYFLAASAASQLSGYGMTVDERTGLPLIQYSDVKAIDDARVTNQYLAIGFAAGGAALAIAAIVTWALPDPRRGSSSRRDVGFTASPAGIGITF